MQHFKTVLGDISESDLGITLVHEHVCCYSQYLYMMAGKYYLNKKELSNKKAEKIMIENPLKMLKCGE